MKYCYTYYLNTLNGYLNALMQNVMIRKLFRRKDKKCVRTHINTVVLCVVHMAVAHTYTLSLFTILLQTTVTASGPSLSYVVCFISYTFVLPFHISYLLKTLLCAIRDDGYIVRNADKQYFANRLSFVRSRAFQCISHIYTHSLHETPHLIVIEASE